MLVIASFYMLKNRTIRRTSLEDEYKTGYYAIIPATIRHNKDLKPAEKLLYGEITSLANKNGFCCI